MSLNLLKKRGLLLPGAIGLGLALLITALLCVLLAALIHRETLPMGAGRPGAAAAAGVSVFAATLFVAKLRHRQAMPVAGVIAGGFLLLAALVCALGGQNFQFGPWLLRLGAAVAVGGVLGAVMSIGQNGHSKKRTRRR